MFSAALSASALCPRQGVLAMRRLLAIATVAVSLSAATQAQAERRMFIIPSNVDGYGVDRCLASGEKCGAAAAAAYCRSRQFAEAASYRRVDRDEITGSIPVSAPGTCHGGACDEFVAIVCAR
jgi:hypothetical protein